MKLEITGNCGDVQAPSTNLAGLADEHLDSRIVKHASEIDKALEDVAAGQRMVAAGQKMAVEGAYELGGCLNEKKKRLSHGKWLDWLEESGIEKRPAQDYMRLATQIRSASYLKPSIRETLKSLPPPKGRPIKDDGGMTPLELQKIETDTANERARIAESKLGNLQVKEVEKDEQIALMTENPDSPAAAWHKRETESLERVRLKLYEKGEALSRMTKDCDYWKRRFRKLLKGVEKLEQTKAVVDLLAEYGRAVVESPTARDHLEANADQIMKERAN